MLHLPYEVEFTTCFMRWVNVHLTCTWYAPDMHMTCTWLHNTYTHSTYTKHSHKWHAPDMHLTCSWHTRTLTCKMWINHSSSPPPSTFQIHGPVSKLSLFYPLMLWVDTMAAANCHLCISENSSTRAISFNRGNYFHWPRPPSFTTGCQSKL